MMHETTLGKVFMRGLFCGALAACSSNSNDSDSDAPSGQGGTAPSGGGSSGSNTGGMPVLPVGGGGGGGDDDERFDSCQDFVIPPRTGVPRPTGSAQVSMTATGTAAAVDVELIEVACEAVHDRDGQVAGFRASFFETWDRPGQTPAYASVTWEGAFAGNGTYEEASFSYSADASFGSRDTEFRSGTLTLSEGGRVGTFSANAGDATLTFSCASADRLSTAAKPPVTAEVPPGMLRIWGEDVPVYEFPNIECGIVPGSEEVDPFGLDSEINSPYIVHVTLEGRGTGSHGIQSFLFDLNYAGLIDYSLLGGDVTLECGFPSRGTLELSTQTGEEITGAFTCPD